MMAPRGRALGVGWVTLALWALAAASVAAWALRLQAPADLVTAPPALPAGPVVDAQVVALALGGSGAASAPSSAVAASAPSRWTLQGVVTQGGGGAALIAIDGKPAKPYAAGARLDDRWMVRAVHRHEVVLGGPDGAITLHMPPLNQRTRVGDGVAAMRAGVPPTGVAPVNPVPGIGTLPTPNPPMPPAPMAQPGF